MERYDVYSRFARRHLDTREERAVYLTLAGREGGSWSVRELAQRNHLDPDDTERVLEAFEAAGVVDAIDAPEGRRYRWRSDMNYLFGENDPPGPVDPSAACPCSRTARTSPMTHTAGRGGSAPRSAEPRSWHRRARSAGRRRQMSERRCSPVGPSAPLIARSAPTARPPLALSGAPETRIGLGSLTPTERARRFWTATAAPPTT